jgi:branched-chain amino acid transport system substrate-binding protein
MLTHTFIYLLKQLWRGNNMPRKMREAITKTQTILIAAIIIVAACIGGAGYYLLRPTSQVPTEIKIGVSIAVSGWASTTSRPALDGYLIAQDFINEKLGGIYVKEYDTKLPLKIIYYDDQSDPAVARGNYEKLMATDGVVACIGPWSTTIAYPCTVLAEKYEIPMLMFGAYADKIYAQGLKYIFNMDFVGTRIGAMHIETIASKFPQIKTAATIVEDTEYTRLIAQGVEGACRKFNITMLYSAVVPSNTKDFSPQILQIKALAPDLFITCQYILGDVEVMKELQEYDVNPMLIGAVSDWEMAFIPSLGRLAEYVYGHNRPIRHFEQQVAYLDNHTDAFPGGGDIYRYAWDRMKEGNVSSGVKTELNDRDTVGLATFMPLEYPLKMKTFIEKADTLDPHDIRDAMAGIDTFMFGGPLKFNAAGVNTYGGPLFNQIRNGQYVIYYPLAGDQPQGELVSRPKWSEISP